MAPASNSIAEQEHVVVASADAEFHSWVRESLQSTRWTTMEAAGGATALEAIDEHPCQVLLLDRHLPDLEVTELVSLVKSRYPKMEVLVMDSRCGPSPQNLSEPVAAGVKDILGLLGAPRKPPARFVHLKTVDGPLFRAPTHCSPVTPLPGMIGTSPKMANVYRLVQMIAPRFKTALVLGETGTGKELVAHAIHQLSPRARGPFVAVHCGAIPESLVEAELFGYERGSFTGAVQSRRGRVQAAAGGTLFLDEIGDLPLSMQVKILRFLQAGEIQRIGFPETTRIDVSVVAATNVDLRRHVAEGKFREDLFYRLSVFPIVLPPLRERILDIQTLAEHFVSSLCRTAGVPLVNLPPDAIKILQTHHWPGNVRELQHAMERAFLLLLDEQSRECARCAAALLLQKPTACPNNRLSACLFDQPV
jgi:DNA-binding NtrC family response regulator